MTLTLTGSRLSARFGRRLQFLTASAVLLFGAAASVRATDLYITADPSLSGFGTVLGNRVRATYVSGSVTSIVTSFTTTNLTGLPDGAVVTINATVGGYSKYGTPIWSMLSGDADVLDANTNTTTITINSSSGGSVQLIANFDRTKYLLALLNDGHGTTSPLNNNTNNNVAGYQLQIIATPSAGYTFSYWEGGPVANAGSSNTMVTYDADKSVKAHFTRTWTFSQKHRFGPNDSSTGVQTLPEGDETVSVPNAIVAGTPNVSQYRCTGFASGVNVGAASANQTTWSFQLTNNASLDWQWLTQYYLTVGPNNSQFGYTIPQGTNLPYDVGTKVILTAVALGSAAFQEWESAGAFISGSSVYTQLMNNAYVLTADFALTKPDTDNDGLPDWWEKKYGLNPNSADGVNGPQGDPDGDGLSNILEYRLTNTNLDLYCSPIDCDSDNDGMDDQYERFSVDPVSVPPGALPDLSAAVDNGQVNPDNGAAGNPDLDFKWSTVDGYQDLNEDLSNIEEYTGPDGQPPYTFVTYGPSDPANPLVIAGNLTPKAVRVRVRNPLDTQSDPIWGDTSKANTTDTDRDKFDDGFEWSWDVWQRTHSGEQEVIVTGPRDISITNTVPVWNKDNTATRRFNPNSSHGLVAGGDQAPDGDILYDFNTGGVSPYWFSDWLEYNAWNTDVFSPLVNGAPHVIRRDQYPNRPRSSHPFKFDADGDGLPDGYEVVMGYDPWAQVTPGETEIDGDRNPDGDWFAYDATTSNRHHAVYAELLTNVTVTVTTNVIPWVTNQVITVTGGFDPRTGWGEFYATPDTMPIPLERTPNTEKYSNKEEIRGADGMIALVPALVDDATNPFKNDTDGDGMWDGWEAYVGLDPNNKLDGGASDKDTDGLVNFAEFNSMMTSSTDPLALTPLPEWMNKIFPTDPNDADTDGDGIGDGGGIHDPNHPLQNVKGENAFFNGGSGTFTNDFIDIATGFVTNQVFVFGAWNGRCYTGGGLNPCSADTDNDGLPDPWESAHPAADGTMNDSLNDPDGDGLKNYQEYMTAAVTVWQWDKYPGATVDSYFTGTPKTWDWYAKCNAMPFRYIPGGTVSADGVLTVGNYSSTDPGNADTDQDGMDDYYEIYHGMDPIYGGLDLVMMRVKPGPLAFVGPGPDGDGMPLTGDPRLMPWVTGTLFEDPDNDGVANRDEAAGQSSGKRLHTDPTPMWITDFSYPFSWVNLYYRPSGAVWYWGKIDNIPAYMYDFELNEGYDTDHDNVGDFQEASKGLDPLNSESPIKRRALYLDPAQDAYARTAAGYFYANFALETFTVEAWVRPINPASGAMQTIVERPLMIPIGTAPWLPGIRLNFRIALDPAGIPYAEYNTAGVEISNVVAKSSNPATSLPSNTWTHLAATYRLQNGHGTLTFYVNGQVAQAIPSDTPPVQGQFGADTSGNLTFFYAPIVIGASDLNPDGIISTMAGGKEPQPANFFKGWIDEVRIWNGARSGTDIAGNMMKRMRKADVSAASTNGAALLSLYTFDNLPDPNFDGIVPTGFTAAMNYTPADWTSVQWWSFDTERSLVYTDYRYVPWIEDGVAHVARVPASDIGDPSLLSTNALGQNVAPYKNSANPYGFGYLSIITPLSGVDKAKLEQKTTFPDLLPLRGARTDQNLVMWDGGGNPAVDPFDSDHDGLPDAWEEQYGLDPLSAVGVNGAWGDPDGDGLVNKYEYFAGTNPRRADTFGTGFPDFNNGPWATNGFQAPFLSFGEIYSDRDPMPDAWEVANGLDPYTYDANLDKDNDGWSNYAEYIGNTGPSAALSHPNPVISGVVVYDGPNITGPLVVQAYQNPAMVGTPIVGTIGGGDVKTANEVIGQGDGHTSVFAGQLLQGSIVKGSVRVYRLDNLFVMPNNDFKDDAQGHWTFSPDYFTTEPGDQFVQFDYSTGVYSFTYPPNEGIGVPYSTSIVLISYQYKNADPNSYSVNGLKEGPVYLLAFRDVNNNGILDPGEPAGTYWNQPIYLEWGDVPGINIGLTDQSSVPWYPRFSWLPPAGLNSYYIEIYSLGAGSTRIITNSMSGRTFFFEADYQQLPPYDFGLPSGQSYAWRVYSNSLQGAKQIPGGGGTNYVPILSPSMPVLTAPVNNGYDIVHPTFNFQWTDALSAGFELQIGPSGGPWLYDQTFVAPARTATGAYSIPTPVIFGMTNGVWTNGVYQWRMRAFVNNVWTSWATTPKLWSGWSPSQVFNINLNPAPLSAQMITGDVYYFGKATGTDDMSIVVQAFQSSGFSDPPAAQVIVHHTCNSSTNAIFDRGTFALLGLNPGRYYIRAFLDSNLNGIPDVWETQGFVADPAFRPQPEDVSDVQPSVTNLRLVMYDRDTDNDHLPDAWEWYITSKHGAGTLQYGPNSAPYSVTFSNAYAATLWDADPLSPDSDGDGISNVDEIRMGLNPCNADTDGDGLDDGREIALGTDPKNPDTDGDGLSDGTEVNAYHTDPLNPDTDGDGMNDGAEVIAGTDPLNPKDFLSIGVAAGAGGSLNQPLTQGIGAGTGIQWQGKGGRTYWIQESFDMVHWQDVSTFQGAGAHSFVNGSAAGTNGPVFYRLRVANQ